MQKLSCSNDYDTLPMCLKQVIYRMQTWLLPMEVWAAVWEATLHFWKLYFKEIDSRSIGQCLEVILSRCKIKLIANQLHMLTQIRVLCAELLGGHRCVFGSCRDWGLLLTMGLPRVGKRGLLPLPQTDSSCLSSELIHRKSVLDPL